MKSHRSLMSSWLTALVFAFPFTSCTEPKPRNPVEALPSVQPVAKRKLKKPRVLLRNFEFEGSARASDQHLAVATLELCSRALARDARFVRVDDQELLLAPDVFQPALYDFLLLGELIVENQQLVGVRLHAVQRGQLVASFEEPRTPMPIERASIERLGLDALTARMGDRLAEFPWATSVLDMAERLIIVGGGAETGLALGEQLVVRRVQSGGFERGIESWLALPAVEVARIEVEAFVGTGSASQGAQCRLKGGSFGGFDIADLVVTLPDEAR